MTGQTSTIDDPARNTCPCCGQTVKQLQSVALVDLNRNTIYGPGGSLVVGGQLVELVYILARRPGQCVSYDEIINGFYGVLADEPEHPKRLVTVRVSQARRLIKPIGLAIKSHRGRGYELVRSDDYEGTA